MRSNEIKPLLTRITNLARKEHRTLAGQLAAILELYEKQTGITSKRPYNRKSTPVTGKKKDKPRLKSVASKGVAVTRKVRSDAGKKRGPYKKRKVTSVSSKLLAARKKLAALKSKAK